MYTLNQQFLLLLESLNISKNTIRKFYKNYHYVDDFFKLFDGDKNEVFGFNAKEYKMIKTAILNKNHEKFIQKLDKMRIFCLFYGCEYYPKNYIDMDDAPIVLYTIGDVSLLSCTLISIIGTRKPTNYGKSVLKTFVKGLLDANVIPVSDLAYGIDGLVASECLDCNGKTIALLAGGLNSIYPSNHTNLARQIVKSGGLLISMYQPGIKPEKSYFVERNRMLAGISDGLLLVEAGEKSATINTVNNALNLGKELFVVPGNINSEMSVGTNNLIAEIPDAFTISPSHIIDRLGLEIVKTNKNEEKFKMELSPEQSIIIDVLYEGELSFDELQEKTKLNVKTLATLLTTLEINGLIKKLPGNYYEKN